MLPFVYKGINEHLDRQEHTLREQKKAWLINMVDIEFGLARKATNREDFWFHYRKGCDYFLLDLQMIQEDLKSILNSL